MKNPELRKMFKQFANTDEIIDKQDMLEFVDMRGQIRPADWSKDGSPQTNWQAPPNDIFANSEKSWVDLGYHASLWGGRNAEYTCKGPCPLPHVKGESREHDPT